MNKKPNQETKDRSKQQRCDRNIKQRIMNESQFAKLNVNQQGSNNRSSLKQKKTF